MADIFDWWEALCIHYGITDIEKTIYLLRELAFDSVLKKIPTTFRPGIRKPDIAFKAGRRARSSNKDATIATIMPAERLHEKIVSADLLRFENSYGVRFPTVRSQWTLDLIRRMQRLPARNRTFRTPATVPLHPVCLWYTRAADLGKKIASTPSRSNAARDTLGLVHYEDATPVAVLYFSHKELNTTADDRPTFVEAADNRRFKTRGDAAATRKRGHWGETTDLEKFATGKLVIDGCPERIVAPVARTFRVRFDILGLTSGKRGISGGTDSDTAFASLLIDTPSRKIRRNKRDVEEKLRQLI